MWVSRPPPHPSPGRPNCPNMIQADCSGSNDECGHGPQRAGIDEGLGTSDWGLAALRRVAGLRVFGSKRSTGQQSNRRTECANESRESHESRPRIGCPKARIHLSSTPHEPEPILPFQDLRTQESSGPGGTRENISGPGTSLVPAGRPRCDQGKTERPVWKSSRPK